MIEKGNIENVIEKYGFCTVKPSGKSMRPFIVQGRDTVELVKPYRELNKYDIVLYERQDGLYCLHRILKVREDDYFIMGDNCVLKEYVKKDKIIALCKGYYKDKKYIDCEKNKSYKFKVRLVCFCVPVRTAFIKFRIFSARVFRKVFKKKKR